MIALFLGKLFGIVQPLQGPTIRGNHRRRRNGAGQRSTPGLVDASHRSDQALVWVPKRIGTTSSTHRSSPTPGRNRLTRGCRTLEPNEAPQVARAEATAPCTNAATSSGGFPWISLRWIMPWNLPSTKIPKEGEDGGSR